MIVIFLVYGLKYSHGDNNLAIVGERQLRNVVLQLVHVACDKENNVMYSSVAVGLCYGFIQHKLATDTFPTVHDRQ